MLIRGRFPDLHLIFCGVENEMPDCKDISPQSRPDYADRKTPDLSRGRSLCWLFSGGAFRTCVARVSVSRHAKVFVFDLGDYPLACAGK
jgi:hypothetical protein